MPGSSGSQTVLRGALVFTEPPLILIPMHFKLLKPNGYYMYHQL